MMKAAQYVLIVILALSLLAPVFLSWQPPAKADTALSFQEQAHPYLPNDVSRFDAGLGAGINIPPPFLVENYGWTCAATYGGATTTAGTQRPSALPSLIFKGWASSPNALGCSYLTSTPASTPTGGGFVLPTNITVSLFLVPTNTPVTLKFNYTYIAPSTSNFYVTISFVPLGSSTPTIVGGLNPAGTSGTFSTATYQIYTTTPFCLRFSGMRQGNANDYFEIKNLNITNGQITDMPSSSRPCLQKNAPNLNFIDYSTGKPRDLIGSVASPLSSNILVNYKSNIPFNFNDLIEYLPFDGRITNPSSYVVFTGINALWQFDEGSGTSTKEYYTGATASATTGTPSWVTGMVGPYSIYLNGAAMGTGTLSSPVYTANMFSLTANGMTVFAVFKTQKTTDDMIVSIRTSQSPPYVVVLKRIQSSDSLAAVIYFNYGSTCASSSSSSASASFSGISAGTVATVAVSFWLGSNGALNIKLYINGAPVATASNVATPCALALTSGATFFGCDVALGTCSGNFILDDVQVYAASMLSDAQVSYLAANYAAPSSIPSLTNMALPGGYATANSSSSSPSPGLIYPSFVSSGKFGGAAQFEFSSSHYNPAVLSDIKLPPLSAFTVSFWFKYVSGSGYAPIVGFGNIISNYVLEVNNGGQLKVEMCSTGATLNPNSAVNLLDGAWHYIAFVFTSPTSVIGYVDGGSASASLSTNFVTSGIPTLAPGVCGAASAGGLTIQLDDFRIYARALSSSEINALYTMTPAQYSSQQIPNPNLPNLFGGYTTLGTQGSQLIYGGVKTSALFIPQLFNYSATAQVTVWYGSYYYRTLVINPNLQSYYGGVWGQYLNVYIDDPSRVVPYVINVIDLAKIFPPGSIVAVLSGNSTIITSGLLDTSMTVFAYLVPGTYNVLLMNPSGQKMNFLVNFGSLSSINIIVPGSNLVVKPGGLPFLSASFVISCDLKTAYLSFTDSYQITASVTFKLYVANVTGNYLVAQQTVTGTVGSNGLSNIGTASVTLTGIPTGATIDQIYAIVNATSLSSVPSSVPAQPYGRVVTTIQPGGTSGTCPGLVVGTPPSFPGDVLGLSQIFPFPNAWLFLLSVSLILMVGFAFSARDADVGTFIMLLMAAAFMAMGWLPLIPGWIITLLFIAFVRLALSRWRRRRMGA